MQVVFDGNMKRGSDSVNRSQGDRKFRLLRLATDFSPWERIALPLSILTVSTVSIEPELETTEVVRIA